ncbi:hypothetical protein VP217E381_P0068 [Vibrio phage 217E38-1]|nr:hypothetical protein VP217E381_P0068 [Vibrio phage 217E38-1]
MALKHNDTLNGIEINGNYVKVLKFDGVKDNLTVIIGYQVDKNSAPYKTKVVDIPYNLDQENPYSLAYKYLKETPEFEGSTDC